MSLKKCISCVSALAVAVSAFAAMAVTASATDYGPTNIISKTKADNATWTSGVVTAGIGKSYGAVRLDFSDLAGIADATSVILEFDTKVYSGSGQTWYGVGDASARTSTVNGSGGYTTVGLGMFFGSQNGNQYNVRDIKKDAYVNTANGAIGVSAHAKITFDKDAGEYSYVIGPLSGTEKTDIANLTILDAYTNVVNGKFDFKNVKVSYTVPDAPAPVSVELDVTAQEACTGDDGSKAVIVKSDFSGVNTIDKLTITADDKTKTFNNGTDFNFNTNFSGSPAEIAVIVKGVSAVTKIAIN